MPPGWTKISHPEGVRYFYNRTKVRRPLSAPKLLIRMLVLTTILMILINPLRRSVRGYTPIPRFKTLSFSIILKTTLHTLRILALLSPFHFLILRNSSSMFTSPEESCARNTIALTTPRELFSFCMSFVQAGLMLG